MRGLRQLLDLLGRWDRRRGVIPLAELIGSLRALVVEPADLGEAVGFDERTYRRAVIRGRDHYQALVLCWRSGQGSPIHDHFGSGCAVRVVAGRVTETRYSPAPCGRLMPVNSEVHLAGSVTACRGGEIHQMANLEDEGDDLITLHVYSPPPVSWRFYHASETTLANHDQQIQTPARTIRVELGHPAPGRPLGTKTRGGLRWRR
jgi:cysteine dioxygenase